MLRVLLLLTLILINFPSNSAAGQINTDLNIEISQSDKKKINENIKKYNLELSLKKRYLDDILLFEKIKNKLILNELPGDFAYIIMVESKFDPKCKADKYRGLWQLNPYLGRKFGDIGASELYDPDKSTEVAINYLLYLQKEFNNDHRLMLYAYNFGETNIKNLIKKYGKNIPKNKLPRITRNYIPNMMAAKYVLDRWENEELNSKPKE